MAAPSDIPPFLSYSSSTPPNLYSKIPTIGAHAVLGDRPTGLGPGLPAFLFDPEDIILAVCLLRLEVKVCAYGREGKGCEEEFAVTIEEWRGWVVWY